ncbi:unnamed protein product [Schistosoma margrebowiei]|uniref:UPAR/Ly6 domain-containing protein n=1 Tax=Schistosoma margrebowiei TaxID=48269 RepID=A0AA84ZRV2_9TREM|nr:unnamed protein product [Schistosoma margrebowiei]
MYLEQIILVTMLLLINTEHSLSLKCYTCSFCSIPFDPNSPLVTEHDDCTWCAKITIKGIPFPHRLCSADCGFNYWKRNFTSFSYDCCQTDLCNKSIQIRVTHKFLLSLVLIFICYIINKKN